MNRFLTRALMILIGLAPLTALAQLKQEDIPRLEKEWELQQRQAEARWQKAANDATDRMGKAHKLWDQGHRQEAITILLIAHRDMNSLLGAPENDPFDDSSGAMLAEMYQETGELTEAYLLYRRLVEPVNGKTPGYVRERPDLRLSYYEVCLALKKDGEAKRIFAAFQKLAKGDPVKVYRASAIYAYRSGRLDAAERWFREALRLAPDDATAKEGLEDTVAAKKSGAKSSVG